MRKTTFEISLQIGRSAEVNSQTEFRKGEMKKGDAFRKKGGPCLSVWIFELILGKGECTRDSRSMCEKNFEMFESHEIIRSTVGATLAEKDQEEFRDQSIYEMLWKWKEWCHFMGFSALMVLWHSLLRTYSVKPGAPASKSLEHPLSAVFKDIKKISNEEIFYKY